MVSPRAQPTFGTPWIQLMRLLPFTHTSKSGFESPSKFTTLAAHGRLPAAMSTCGFNQLLVPSKFGDRIDTTFEASADTTTSRLPLPSVSPRLTKRGSAAVAKLCATHALVFVL